MIKITDLGVNFSEEIIFLQKNKYNFP